MKYNKAMIKQCTDWVAQYGLIDDKGAKLVDFLDAMNIDQRTYYRWIEKTEFAESIEKAKSQFKATRIKRLVNTLHTLAEGGQEYTELKRRKEYLPTVDGKQGQLAKMIEEEKVSKTSPNLGAVIFLLTNLDPQNWQNKQHNDVAVKKEEKEEMTREEMIKELERLEELDRLDNQQDADNKG